MATKPSPVRRMLHTLLALDRTDYAIRVERITLPCPQLPAAFEGARIALVSDLHLPDIAVPPGELLAMLRQLRPDAIFLTGDLTNSYTYFDEAHLRRMVAAMAAMAPCFAIPGNHEWRLGREPLYRRAVTEAGAVYLCDSFAPWQRGEHNLQLYGMGRHCPAPLGLEGQPTLVLAHKPEYLPYFRRARWDAVFCGHAHGGQVRWGDRALYAPGQGFLPRYTGGLYRAGATRMVVSRGLGNSSIPWRLGNHPHLPLITLKGEAHA